MEIVILMGDLEMKTQAIDIAKYVIKYCNDRNIVITNLKLQKLLYFIQAQFIVSYGRVCFNDEIQALPYGPVVLDVYMAYRHYGRNSIPNTHDYRINLDEDDCYLIDKILEKLANRDPFELVEITHNQDPWRDAYNRKSGAVITIDAIRKYFLG